MQRHSPSRRPPGPHRRGISRNRVSHLRRELQELLATELAAEFNVSRTPVRQALQRLDYEGLVETKNGVGRQSPELISRNSRMSTLSV
ncbi:GntR family transcriptional regulator [Mesorhizobium sp. M1233]